MVRASLTSPDFHALLRQCVNCGMCLTSCPTYEIFGTEMDSPRGRIALLRAVAEGRIEPTGSFQVHFDRCLGCLSCVVTCPSGVQYRTLLDTAKIISLQARRPGWLEVIIRWLALRQLFPYPGRMEFLAWFGLLYERSGIRILVRRLHLIPRSLRPLERLLPERDYLVARTSEVPEQANPAGRSPRVALFRGCVQDAFLKPVNQATVRILDRLGATLLDMPGQTCCGAAHIHLGERELARRLARQNMEAFFRSGAELLITNAGGCGAALKEYPDLFRDQPEGFQQAQRFASMVCDVSEFLVEYRNTTSWEHNPIRVTYADSCHLRHAQGVIDQPRELLNAIRGVELVELEHPGACCGSAGVYNIMQPEIADAILEKKLEDIAATGAEVVVTSNPGCQLQIMAGARRAGMQVQVLHLVELIDRSRAVHGERHAVA